jgi:rare lipoprotein A
LEGSDDRQLMATLRTGVPAPSPSMARVASARPFVPDMSGSSRGQIRGEVPLPEGRPYSLGNTSADVASINATSEMSASSRSRGRALQNARAVSYDEEGRYVADRRASSAYASDGAAEARDILSGRGLY